MRVLRPTLELPDFVSRREQLLADRYYLLAIRVGERVVSIASYTILPHVTFSRELLVHDKATLLAWQGKGYAGMLINKIVTIAEKQSCGRISVQTRNAQFSPFVSEMASANTQVA
jgi:hypothetical protein